MRSKQTQLYGLLFCLTEALQMQCKVQTADGYTEQVVYIAGATDSGSEQTWRVARVVGEVQCVGCVCVCVCVCVWTEWEGIK